MFRQVVAYRWSTDASDADRAAFIVAIEGLPGVRHVQDPVLADSLVEKNPDLTDCASWMGVICVLQ